MAVSLTQARINMDSSNPAVYLTQDLTNVYKYTDPRTYPMSSYSYMILPTTIQGAFTRAKGTTLGAFSYYFMCQGQRDAPQLGYSPLPINLVKAGFQQILKIPGVQPQTITVSGCNNPTFDPSDPNDNKLAATASYPQACDKQGPVQCATGTAGDKQSTPVTGSGGGGNSGGGSNSGGGANSGRGGNSGGPGGSSGPGHSGSPGAAGTNSAKPPGQPRQPARPPRAASTRTPGCPPTACRPTPPDQEPWAHSRSTPSRYR